MLEILTLRPCSSPSLLSRKTKMFNITPISSHNCTANADSKQRARTFVSTIEMGLVPREML